MTSLQNYLDETPTILTLANGLRLTYRYAPITRLAHCGVIINAGTRDERPDEMGIAHFLEHLTFKGTQKRKAVQILSRIDSVGGELNAYTTKDKTCFYTSTADEYFERAMELLADVVFNSTYPAKEIEKEKNVVREEIDMYQDNPEETIFEAFEKAAFEGHPMSFPILGLKKTIARFDAEMLRAFFARRYTAENIVVSVTGNVPPEKVITVAQKYFAETSIGRGTSQPREAPAPRPNPVRWVKRKPYQQANFILGGNAYPHRQGNYYAMQLLVNYLGGPSMNSRLNLAIREKYGLTYNLYAFYTPMLDSGLWGVYGGCEEAALKKTLLLLQNELTTLCENPPADAKLDKIKRQYIGHMRLSSEGLGAQMLAFGKETLDYGRIRSLEESVDCINAVTAEQIAEAVETYLLPDVLNRVIYLPERNRLPQNGSARLSVS